MEKITFPRPLGEFAKRVGVDISILYKIEQGKRPATEHQARAIHWRSNAEIPAWVLRPDIWCEGQNPPALDHLEKAS